MDKETKRTGTYQGPGKGSCLLLCTQSAGDIPFLVRFVLMYAPILQHHYDRFYLYKINE